ncbi:MAG: methionyl-tRNA formyltransferase [Clostridiales bacterium]|nr:methionyl-tRNA formyltransferase [Clostridiales bacterium]MBS5877975.1 methionyl-tRNA formyltransferase [Clostridiales bacterium]MDU0939869.1 methionyl-tRNA formyltransferase [Clostridiales bacterium]MDU1042449.1 methionyl-tRNA formyltransferase [Clostridiales bacterium]MDU3489741.1 methionyl-tRNA formyltransferase [Clostridiales bacterium]
MKIVFMGTPDFATETLKAVIQAGHEVAAVVTQPDRPVKRSKKPVYSPVKEIAVELGLTVLQPEKARDPELVETIRSVSPDAIVVVAYGQILSKDLLDIPRFGCINVHASLLPKYRGASPIQWAVINGDEYSGVTTMLMEEGLDTGDILLVEKVKLDPKETGGSLFDRLSSVGADLLVKTLEELEKGGIHPVKQDEDKASLVKMLNKKMGELDFTRPALELERLIRGLNPWPSAYTHLGNKKLTIWAADVIDPESEPESKDKFKNVCPGQIADMRKNSFDIACIESNGAVSGLRVTEVQLEGKKRMKVGDFLNGKALKLGDKLI